MATNQFIQIDLFPVGPKRDHQNNRFDPDQEKAIAEEYASGLSVSEISRRWGCHRTQIVIVAKRLGIPPRTFRAINLSGQAFGLWRVLSYAGIGAHGASKWLCQCKCGREKVVSRDTLTRTGGDRGCGICHPEPTNFRDLTGQRFGYLTVVRQNGRRGSSVIWLCKCDCGKEKNVVASSLVRKHTRSCSCMRNEMLAKRQTTHGYSKKTIYHVWTGLRGRCNNPRNPSYVNYGGRGITVCKEWNDSFEAFYAYVGERPQKGWHIDRIDTNGNYEPGNVRWVSPKESQSNRRDTVFITFEGKKMCRSDWAREKGLKDCTLKNRLLYGWSLEKAMNTPVAKRASC